VSRQSPALPISTLVDQFLAYAEPICKDPATPLHTLRVAENRHEAVLVFPAQSPDGFEVRITIDRLGIRVHSGKLVHAQIDHVADLAGGIEAAFGMVRDLLSPDMRLTERYAGKQIIWAAIERFDGTEWRRSYDTGLLLFNYFRKRRESVFVNRHLPGRLSAGLNKKA
jgi:hypothetical protein